ILPSNIRIDDFTDSSNLHNAGRPWVALALHLLTHIHTDPIGGLSDKSFGHQVICSIDANEIPLQHEVYGARRVVHEQEMRSEKLRTFSHFKVDPRVMPNGEIYHTGARDLLESATSGLIELMRLLPEVSIFFPSTWTWGYEDIVKAISITFYSKIHVDRYKHNICTSISDSDLRGLASKEPRTRGNACERFSRCRRVAVENGTTKDKEGKYSTVNADKKAVTYVNPGSRMGKVLLLRHSPFQELRSSVSLFQPRRVVPNTLIPGLRHLDCKMFSHCLAPSAKLAMSILSISHTDYQYLAMKK
ncbi:hypothetical protein FIBSPDRAFT_737483, partial [Athelia psychrophila]